MYKDRSFAETAETFETRCRRMALALASTGLLALSLLATTGQASAQSLEGSWSGSGTVAFSSGASERARCRARYSRKSETTYVLVATCATPSGKASQTASLRKTGKSSYAGSFHNAEYNVSGTIFVTVHGSSQSVRLSGEGGTSASLRLSR